MGRLRSMTPAHKAKIADALRRYGARPDAHTKHQPSGFAAHNWKGGVAPRTYRKIAFTAHGRFCQQCGDDSDLLVRHMDGRFDNPAPDNLIVLCRSCHYTLYRDNDGENNPAYLNGIGCYRKRALDAFGAVCQRCASTRFIVVHHKDRDRTHNDLDNLEVLCRRCHNDEHGIATLPRTRRVAA